MSDPDQALTIESPGPAFEPPLYRQLEAALAACPDLAFAHLARVRVAGQEGAELVLFVWLVPAALGSIRMALNLVSEAVARALPEDRYLDVVILNSAPELLLAVEAAGCVMAVRDADERTRALAAAASGDDPAGDERSSRRSWWWPF